MSGTAAICAAIVLAGSLAGILRAHADGDDRNAEESKIRRGFEIAPVPLNLRNKNRELVGLGSLYRECGRRLQRLPHDFQRHAIRARGQSLL